MQRFRGGADAARAFLINLRKSDVRNQVVDERTPSGVCSATLRSSQLARRPLAVQKRNWSLVCPCIRGWSKWDTRRRCSNKQTILGPELLRSPAEGYSCRPCS